ncbi:MAG: 4-hydroxy-tetrahydrodipicolinate synthase [Gemmatimonadetes bacterium GWC2_71_10]|nr:MAG: 4-hydroxy-tetrahydrodipicolinate synthase [Gemmatimonadetes bacterium GWC2_71_10]
MALELKGCLTALVTPFTRDGSVDEPALRHLAEWQIASGIHGLVPVGSTGEAATLSPDERVRVTSIVAEVAGGRLPVVAGAGTNDTKVAIAWSKQMAAAGATHLLHVSPAYSKPPQRGLLAHYRAIADAAPRPIVVYNVPGRTASNVEADTTLALAEHPNIVAVKEACGNLAQIGDIIKRRPRGFAVLSGDDALTVEIMQRGGEGIISVISNAAPAQMAELCNAALAGDFARACTLHLKLEPLMKAAFVESNPIPIKAALAMERRIENVLRLPLVPLDGKYEGELRRSLIAAGALTGAW